MPLPTPSDDCPWPAQTPPPSQPRDRRSLSLEHRSLSARQDVFNQSGVGVFFPPFSSRQGYSLPPVIPLIAHNIFYFISLFDVI